MNLLYWLLDCVCGEKVENGTLGYIAEPVDDYNTVYSFVVGAPTNNETIAMVYNPIGYPSIVQAGTPFRVYLPKGYERFEIVSKESVKILEFSKDLEPRYFTIDD